MTDNATTPEAPASASLPVVDLAPAFQSVPDFEAIARQIRPALETSGFFYLANHGIAALTLSSLVAQMRAFFDADVALRESVAIDRNNRGWLAPGQAHMKGARLHDLKEVFFFGRELAIDDPDLLAGVALCAQNRWPADHAAFRRATLDWLTAVGRAAERLLSGFAIHLGRPAGFFEPFYTRPMTRGQLIHYPAVAPGTPVDQFGVAEHSDFGCITLLHQESPGLEVLTLQGEWRPLPPIPGHLVVNIGDLLERWTGGALPSTRHRVRNLTGASRYSIAVFYDPSPTAVIDATDLGVPAGRFAPIGAAEYIMSQNRAVFAQYQAND